MRRTDLVTDRYLILALAVGAALVLNGIWWGWVEHWDPDQMVFKGLIGVKGRGFLEPETFLKPPFHTYLNFFLSVLPIKGAERLIEFLTGGHPNFGPIALWWSRLIQLSLFIGIIYLSYRITARFTSCAAARIIALLTASSAGLVMEAHFLTADIPVTFWMLASFSLAQSILYTGRMRDYVLAGFVAGLATATKYNGLAVAVAIPIFHLFSNRSAPLLSTAFDRRLVCGVAMVAVGFVVANPYAVFDFPSFRSDFMYNYITTPVYGGQSGGFGYIKFLLAIPEIVGWPLTVATALALIYVIVELRGASLEQRGSVLAAFGVFALYFWKFGAPPRVPVRFVVPTIPFVMISTGPFWSALVGRFRYVAVCFVAVLTMYNMVASYWVGRRFATDPRMAAQSWVAVEVPAGSVMESSRFTPKWNLYPGINIKDVRMPMVSGRKRLFSNLFQNPRMLRELHARMSDASVKWYNPAALAARGPDFVAVDSLYMERFVRKGALKGSLYPEIRDFFTELLAGHLGYRVVFDRSARGSPPWLYPKRIPHVDNQIVILRRQ
jgi:hypothetical protein